MTSVHVTDAGEGLLSEDAATSRTAAEHVWDRISGTCASGGKQRTVWDNDFSGRLPCILAEFAAGKTSAADCSHKLKSYAKGEAAACVCGSHGSVSRMHSELCLWHAAWRRARCTDADHLDLNNAFGWHALPAQDSAWSSEPFVSSWMALARSGCRGNSDHLPVANGPLNAASELMLAANRLLPSGYRFISVAGSGTEAILSMYGIADAYANTHSTTPEVPLPVTGSQLLFFRGCYVGGAHGLQGANGIDFIARQAFAPTTVPEQCLIDAPPYSRAALDELNALAGRTEAKAQPATQAPSTRAAQEATVAGQEEGVELANMGLEALELSEAEARTLRTIDGRIGELRAAGVTLAGMVIEVVSSHAIQGLRPAFLARLRELLTARRMLIFEDAVMTGLRCGAPFLGDATGLRPDFVAVGKAWGFSGVVAREAAVQLVPWQRSPSYHNGYFTMRMSAADHLRALTVLAAVHQRGLMANALRSGRRLIRCLRAQGLHAWGLGLLIGYDEEAAGTDGTTEVRLLNASAAFCRLLPPLTLGEAESDWWYLSSSVVAGDEAAERVAERVLWLRVEGERCGDEMEAHALGSRAHTTQGSYLPALERVLRDGVTLASYQSILSPKVRQRLRLSVPPLPRASTPAMTSAASAGGPAPGGAHFEPVAALWADVFGM